MIDQPSSISRSDVGYWVDGEILRRFMSCEDPMDDILRNANEPILKHRDILCEHGGLHPRVSRRGKLLSPESYKAYTSLLYAEKQLIMKDRGTSCGKIKCDLHISTKSNLRCTICAEKYKAELKEKLDKFRCLAKLYHALDPSNDILISEQRDDEELYVVSRIFVTNFRKFALKLMKEATGTGAKTSNAILESNAGIDAFDIKTLVPWSYDTLSDDGIMKVDQGAIDPSVNGKITCECYHICLYFLQDIPLTFF